MNRNNIFYRKWSQLLSWFGDIMIRTKPPKVKGNHIRIMLDELRDGDIICRSYSCYLDSHFIKGKYTHSGIYCGMNIVHAVAEGVQSIDVIDFVKDCDSFIILRPPYQSTEHAIKAMAFAIENIGKPYDFLFDKAETDFFYCHELTYKSLKCASIVLDIENSHIYARDLINGCKITYVGGEGYGKG